MQAFLWAAHGVYASAQIATASLLRDWHPLDELKPADGSGSKAAAGAASPSAAATSASASSAAQPAAPLTALEQAQRSGRALPLTHARSRPGLLLQLLCAALALLACTRVLPQAERELRVAMATHFSPAGVAARAHPIHHRSRGAAAASGADAVGPRGDRNAPRHAEDLVPIQRGGRRTVREIMEQDVAHLLPPRTTTGQPQPQPQLQRTFSETERRNAGASAHSKEEDGSALGGVVFHALGLLLSLAHWCFYAGWSRLNPQRRWSTPGHLVLSRGASRHFRATTATGALMQLANTLALYCLMRAGTDSDSLEDWGHDSSHVDSLLADQADPLLSVRAAATVSPGGLLTGLAYLAYFLVHTHRFALNAQLWWRFRSFFPRIGVPPKRKVRGARAAAAAATSATASGSAGDLRKRERGVRRRRAAAEEEEEGAGFDAEMEQIDMHELAALAAFASDSGNGSGHAAPSPRAIAAALELDPSGDTLMAPSPLIQKLRNTPKLEEVRIKEQKERIKKMQESKDA